MFGEPIIQDTYSNYYLEENIAYVKQLDTFNSINTGRTLSERDYSIKEIDRLEHILINLTEGAL